MGTAVTVQSAPETRAICRELTDHLSAPTTKTEFRDAAELRAEYESINKRLETTASLAKKLIDEEVIPGLKKMQALLSQRGAKHDQLRRDAGLPIWTEYFEAFRLKFDLKSLRTFQRRQLVSAGSSAQSKKVAPKRRPRFNTGAGLCDHLGMLTDLLDQIEKMSDRVPQALMNTVAQYRKILNTEKTKISEAPPKIVPQAAVPTSPSQKATEKGIARTVSEAVKNRGGRLIAL